MNPESTGVTSVTVLRALRQRKDEVLEITQLTSRLQSQWESKRREGSLSPQEVEVIQSIRNRLSELADAIRQDLTQSLLKLELLKREVQHQTDRRVALFEAKLKPIPETIRALDGFLTVAQPSGAETREKASAITKRKPKTAAKAKSRKGPVSRGTRRQQGTKSAPSAAAKETSVPEAEVENQQGTAATKTAIKGGARKRSKKQ